MESNKLLSQKEVAAIIGFSPRTIRNWIRAGQFPEPYTIIVGRPYWDRSQIDNWYITRGEAEKGGKRRN